MPSIVYRGLVQGSALLDQKSHFELDLESGSPLPPDFTGPVEFEIDLTSDGRIMSSLFVMPAFLVTKKLYEALRAAGVDNVDPYPAIIRNTESGEQFDDYLFLNVVGLIACADLANSDYQEISPDVKMVDTMAIKREDVPDVPMFRMAEDPLKVVVSDKVQRQLIEAGFTDIHFEAATIT
jgi:hypothetical protein